LRDFCESEKIGEKWANGAKLPTPARGKSARWFSRKKLVSKRSFVDFLHPRNTFKYSAAGQRVVGQLESWGLKKGKK
jgi:hypothetical protein